MPAVERQSGEVIAGKYRLVAPVGRGGMGSVWRAEHTTLHAPVAVKLVDPKLLDPEAGDVEETRQRFLREAMAAAALRSPHVVQIIDHGIDGDTPFMVLELLEGESLAERLERQPILPAAEVAVIVTHVARALTRAHEAGIIHRDLKPSNIFLVRNDDEEIAKVLDFGVAKMNRPPPAAAGARGTWSRDLVGTPCYMSPEQSQGRRVDERTDIWALGVIAFQCICGRLPFDSDILTELLLKIAVDPLPVPSSFASVPNGFDGWFSRAVDRDTDRRFRSAKELADALREIAIPGSGARSIVGASASSAVAFESAPTLPLARAADQALGPRTGVGVTSNVFPRRPSQRAVVVVVASVVVGVIAALLLRQGEDRALPTGQATADAPASSDRSPAAPMALPGVSSDGIEAAAPPPSSSSGPKGTVAPAHGAPSPAALPKPTAKPTLAPATAATKVVDPRVGF